MAAIDAGLVFLAEQLSVLRKAVQSPDASLAFPADRAREILQSAIRLQHDAQLSMRLLSAALSSSLQPAPTQREVAACVRLISTALDLASETAQLARQILQSAGTKVRTVPNWTATRSDLCLPSATPVLPPLASRLTNPSRQPDCTPLATCHLQTGFAVYSNRGS